MPIVTLTTDFGLDGRYVAQMKGAILTAAPDTTLVDVSHAVPPQDVASGARLLERVAPWYPPGTVHLAVIDPGVGTDRDLVAIESRGQRFVGPDNGLFGWLAGDASVVVIDPDRLPVRGASHTFHGRDLLAPAAGALARGAALGSLGTPKNALRPLPTPPPAAIKPTPGGVRITGRIVEIDHYGNAVTNIPRELLGSVRLEAMRVECAGQTVVGLTRTYGDAPPGSLVALVGSDDDVELAVVNDNAAELHGLTVGDEVVIALDNAQRT